MHYPGQLINCFRELIHDSEEFQNFLESFIHCSGEFIHTGELFALFWRAFYTVLKSYLLRILIEQVSAASRFNLYNCSIFVLELGGLVGNTLDLKLHGDWFVLQRENAIFDKSDLIDLLHCD